VLPHEEQEVPEVGLDQTGRAACWVTCWGHFGLLEDVTDSLRLGFNLAGLLLQFGASEPTGQETGSEYTETGPEQGDEVHTFSKLIQKWIGECSSVTVKRG
jgi:hypothetical protein